MIRYSAMIAVHFENGKAQIRNARVPRVPEGHALIRLLYAGICNTDLELLRGYYGFSGIPGHEFAGEVVQSENTALRGARVVGEINLACRACDWCRRGLERHCPRRKVLGIVDCPGAFRECLTLPEANLHVVPSTIPTTSAVFVEPLAAACEILDQAAIPAGAEVAVLGDGKLGLLIALVLQASGYRVRQFGKHREKLRITGRAGVSVEVAKKTLPRSAFGWVVEATGSSEGLSQAVAMTWPRGTVFMKSTVHGRVRLDTAPVIVHELNLVGSRCGRFEPALRLLANGQIPVEDLISETMPLSNAVSALRRAQQKGVLKVLMSSS